MLRAWKTVLNIRELNDAFYKDLSAWYYYAINHIKLPIRPGYIKSDADNIKAFTVRLICRTIFSWFLKERGLIHKDLLELYDVLDTPKGLLDGEGTKTFLKGNSYYRGILQNVFFAALNTPMDARGGKKACYGRKYLDAGFDYSRFADIPFLNGGLFDRLEEDNYNEVTDDGKLKIPNELFYGKELVMGEGKKALKTQGLNRILTQYVFTIDENTPLEEEVALDPELLGHVFENLLAEIGDDEAAAKSARKASGSYYTPRKIIDYMVNESLLLYLGKELVARDIPKAAALLRDLLYAGKLSDGASPAFCTAVVESLDNLRLLDPACGSGAFPMGALNRIVALLKIVDEDNSLWIDKQVKRLPPELRKQARADFARHNLDYARKLGLIRNCIYGLDIQPTAVMISKLRFFISLLVEQQITGRREDNYGISPLPHLETKIICADSLQDIGKGELFSQHLYDALREARETLYAAGSTDAEREAATQKIAESIYGLYPYFAEKVTGVKYADEKSKRGQNIELIRRWLRNAPMPAPFFAPDVFFPELDGKGFHIVIGNPPYGGTDIPDGVKTALGLASKDPYGAFIARFASGRAGSPLADGGLLAYIVSDTFMTIKSHLPLRRQLMAGLLHKAIRVHPDTFKATVNTCILIAERVAQDALTEQPLRALPAGHHVLMADLTPVNIHEQYDRFLEILNEETRMQAGKAAQASSPEYAVYHYPQHLIATNSNLPFFVASPKLFALMDDMTSSKSSTKKPFVYYECRINNKTKHFFRLGDIYQKSGNNKTWLNQGLFKIVSGIKTGRNQNYLGLNNWSTESGFPTVSENLILSDLDATNLPASMKNEGIKGGRIWVGFEMGMSSDTSEGILPQYYQADAGILINWSVKSVSAMKDEPHSDLANREFRFVSVENQISFSTTGQNAPTFRIATGMVFLNKASRIFLEKADRFEWLGILNSKMVKFLAKNFSNHSVEFGIDDLKAIPVPETVKGIKSFVTQIIAKQKKNPRYDYASAEQVEIDRLVYEAYGLNEEDIQEVEHWYARRYPRLAAAAARRAAAIV